MEILELTPRNTKKPQYIWVEKYRPQTLDAYLGNAKIKAIFQKYIDNKDFCHLLLYGPAGTGKTTLAKLLVKAIPCDSMYINASDENGIDVIRDKIKTFASSCGFKPLKVIILDEADYLTPNAQASLRPIMETYAQNTRFILTGNYHERISDPIKSRVQAFEILPPKKSEVARNLMDILKLENITCTNADIVHIVNTYYPDIRKTIQLAQQYSGVDGKLQLPDGNTIEQDIKHKLVKMLSNKESFLTIRQFIIEQGLTRFEDIYDYLYEKLDEYADGNHAKIILKLADGIKNDTVVVNKQIVFLACIIEILEVLETKEM